MTSVIACFGSVFVQKRGIAVARQRRMMRLGIALTCLVAAALNVSALTIDISTLGSQYYFTWTYHPSNNKSAAEIQSYLEAAPRSVDFDGATLAKIYNSPEAASNFTPTGDYGTYENLWLYVKDGNHNPTAYLINLGALGYDYGQQIILEHFWDGPGGISHSDVLGSPGTGKTHGVPDTGSTMMLLGTALAGLGTVRRFIKR